MNYINIPGVEFSYNDSQHLTVFALDIHHHPAEDTSPCQFRGGLVLTVFNAIMAIGMFRSYE